MAEKVTINDFVAWCTLQIPADRLSALMSDYGLTDDSTDTIVSELANDENFLYDFATLLGESIRDNKKELNRSIGGVSINDDSLKLDDWMQIAEKHKITLATGYVDPATKAGSNTTPAFDWNNLISTVGGVASSIFGKGYNGSGINPGTTPPKTPQTTGSNIALYIIIGVVVLAVIGILWASLAGSKK